MKISELVDGFLTQRTLAVVGVSRKKTDFSRQLVDLMRRNNYTIYPVNPHADELDGEHCYRQVSDIPSPVEGAMLMVSDAQLDAAIRECIAAGISKIWIYGVGHPRKLSMDVLRLSQEKNVSLINGLCPRMFLHDASWPHRLHKWIALRGRTYRTSPA